jgi:hypothetical protein
MVIRFPVGNAAGRIRKVEETLVLGKTTRNAPPAIVHTVSIISPDGL